MSVCSNNGSEDSEECGLVRENQTG